MKEVAMNYRQSMINSAGLMGILVVLGVGMALAQTDPEPKTATPGQKQSTRQAPPPADTGGPIVLTVATDKKSYAAAGPINITLTAKNTTKAPVPLRFSSGQKYDIEIRKGKDRNGEKVWQWSRGKMFMMMITSATIAPDKPTIYKDKFDPEAKGADGKSVKLSTGSYTIVGYLTTMGRAPRPTGSVTIQVQ